MGKKEGEKEGKREGKKQGKKGQLRKSSGVQRGRPKYKNVNDDFPVQDSIVSPIRNQIILYLHSIGLFHGLVFQQKHLNQLKKQDAQRIHAQRINWSSSHEDWNQQEEIIKIKQVIQQENINQFSQSVVIQVFIEIGAILAKQCTRELYLILAKIIKDQNISSETIQQCWYASKFFNGKFTDLRIRFYILILQNQNILFEKFGSLLQDISKQLICVLTKSQQLQNKHVSTSSIQHSSLLSQQYSLQENNYEQSILIRFSQNIMNCLDGEEVIFQEVE